MIIIEENTYQHPSLPNFQHKQMLKMMNLLKKEKKNRDVKHKTAAMIFIAGQKSKRKLHLVRHDTRWTSSEDGLSCLPLDSNTWDVSRMVNGKSLGTTGSKAISAKLPKINEQNCLISHKLKKNNVIWKYYWNLSLNSVFLADFRAKWSQLSFI